MTRVVHFEIGVDNPERAIKFYEAVFGWKITKWDGPVDYWLVVTGKEDEPGIDGALQNRSDAPQPVINIVGTTNIDDSLEKITKAGGSILRPKIAIPGIGWTALAKDTEGNVFGLMQDDPDVK